MKTREEYEKQLDVTFVQSGTEGLERARLELLLDIRELLMWLKDDILFRRVVEERESIASIRRSNSLTTLVDIDV